MSLIDFIEKLRKKPRYVRVQIMWAVVIVCMLFILIGWLWSLGNTMNLATTQSQEQKNVVDNLKDIPSLWQSLSAGVSNVFNSFNETINKLQSSPSATPSTTSAATPSELPKEVLPTE